MEDTNRKPTRRQIKDIIERIAILETKIEDMKENTAEKITDLKTNLAGKHYLKVITLALGGIYLWLGIITRYILMQAK